MYKEKIKKIRADIIKTSYMKRSAHLGSNLSMVEILSACFEFYKKQKCEIVVSKGHAALSFYKTLYYYKFLKKYDFLRKSSKFWGHINRDEKNKFLKFSFGSLGYGLGISAGLSYSNRKKKVICICSDGEINEGSFWESLMFISHHKLKNITLIIDNNKIQSFGYCKEIIDLKDQKKIFKTFNFEVYKCDGHNFQQIMSVLQKKNLLPKILICNTVKGKGISRIENTVSSHYHPPKIEDLKNEK